MQARPLSCAQHVQGRRGNQRRRRRTTHFSPIPPSLYQSEPVCIVSDIITLQPTKLMIQKPHKSIRNLLRGQGPLSGPMTMTNILAIQTDPLPPHALQFWQRQNPARAGQFIRRPRRCNMSRDYDGDRSVGDWDRNALLMCTLCQGRFRRGVGLCKGANGIDDRCGAFFHCVESARVRRDGLDGGLVRDDFGSEGLWTAVEGSAGGGGAGGVGYC